MTYVAARLWIRLRGYWIGQHWMASWLASRRRPKANLAGHPWRCSKLCCWRCGMTCRTCGSPKGWTAGPAFVVSAALLPTSLHLSVPPLCGSARCSCARAWTGFCSMPSRVSSMRAVSLFAPGLWWMRHLSHRSASSTMMKHAGQDIAAASRCTATRRTWRPTRMRGLIRGIEVTTANVHDAAELTAILPDAPGDTYGDSAYAGSRPEAAIRARGGTPRVVHTGTWGGEAARTRLLAHNAEVCRVRCRIEKVFGPTKRCYGMRRMRWIAGKRRKRTGNGRLSNTFSCPRTGLISPKTLSWVFLSKTNGGSVLAPSDAPIGQLF